MRNFFNWKILHQIDQSPKKYIVQRNINVLNAFLYGYEILLELENEEDLKKKYRKTPSAQDYAIKKYKAYNIGTRNLTSIISFISEGQLDLYNNYLNFLKEYESKYPTEEKVTYILRKEISHIEDENKKNKSILYSEDSLPQIPDFKTVLLHIRKRPLMYFGNYSLASIRAFLDGYFFCKNDYEIPFTLFEEKIKSFTESIFCKDLKIENEFTTWDRKYRYERDWNSWGEIDTTKEKEILESFWIDMEMHIEKII